MKISDYLTVVQNAQGERYYYYGELSEFGADEFGGMTRIPKKHWSADDWAEIIGNEFENNNRHHLCQIMGKWLKEMRKKGVSDKSAKKAMAAFAKVF